MARYLGPSEYGTLRYAVSFAGLFTVFNSLGLDSLLPIELVRHEHQRDKLLGTVFTLKLITSFLVLVGAYLILNILDENLLSKYLILIIIFAGVFQSMNVIEGFFQSRIQSKYAVYANVLTMIISSLLKIYLLIKGADLVYFGWVFTFDALVSAVFLLFYYSVNGCSILKWRFDYVIAKGLLYKTKMLIFGLFGAAIYMRADQVIIGKLLGNSAVGVYAVAVTLSELWVFIAISITQTFSTPITNSKRDSELNYLKKIQIQYDILAKIAFLISIGTFILGPYLINILYGPDYYDSILILQILGWSVIFIFFSNGSWSYYYNENLENYASVRLLAGAALNIALNFLLIPAIGLKGAAISTLISYSFSGFTFNFLFKKTRPNFLMQCKSMINIFKLSTWSINYPGYSDATRN
jgi:O-antigen/teichoic acid export membrane protein